VTGATPSAPGPPSAFAAAILPAILAPAAVLLARASSGPVLLPILATLAIYPVLALLVVRRRRRAAAIATLLWAASLSVSVIGLTARRPEAMEPIVFNGADYRDEMFGFIRSGHGREGDPSRFLPQHVLHLAAFCLLAWLSAGLLGIALGAVLVAYMSFYVGSLAAAGAAPALAFAIGWPPWAILRVVAFVLLGVTLAEPLLLAAMRRMRSTATGTPNRPARPEGRLDPWYLTAAALLLADVVLKYLMAPGWAALLRRCLQP
jgi:hypothetical protein